MPNPPAPDDSLFDNSIRREERSALHAELVRRLAQHGVTFPFRGTDDATLADLLSAVEGFERAVSDAGGDLFIDAPDSSEPERPEFVIPHPHTDERVETYIRRVSDATRRLQSLGP